MALRVIILSCACALVVAGSAGARPQAFHGEFINVQLKAYGTYGSCNAGLWTDPSSIGVCTATRGAELGVLGGKMFLTRGSKARWTWKGSELEVYGLDASGETTWKLVGKRSAYSGFYVETGTNLDPARPQTHFISGDLSEHPLLVDVFRHAYSGENGRMSHGYTMTLRGYVRVK